MDANASDSRTLWLGDLDQYMDELFLNSMLKNLNCAEQIVSLKVIKDKQTGLSLKYGFLEFDTHRNAEKFMQDYHGKQIPNTTHKYFKIKWASYGGGVKPTSISSNMASGETSVYVGDLDLSINEAKLLQFFRGKFPSAFSSKIIYENNSKTSKGYGFVKFSNQAEAQKAISECNGQQLNGKNIKVSHAYLKNKEEIKEEEEQNQTEAGHMIKIYKQYYSLMNDPLLKTTYEKQMEQSFGSHEDEKTMKQKLEGLRSLPFEQTKSSEKYLQSLLRWVNNQTKRQIEGRIFC